MGWEVLELWGESTLVEQLSGGVRNDVRLIELNGRQAVARLGQRDDEDLRWETRLLSHLAGSGLGVPDVVATLDGRPFVEGLMVMQFVPGRPPGTPAEWQRVSSYLRRLHQLTLGWEQRPGWASSIDLLTRESGTSVDLRAMPPDAVARCRAAWARLEGQARVVVHGDPNPGNIRIHNEGVVLIDWDEARVDVAGLDLVLPSNAAGLNDEDLAAASQAASAWEAAVCWKAEPDYARRRLAEVEAE